MPFIGDFSLQNIMSNFQRQTKKKIFDVSLLSARRCAIEFLNSGFCRNGKQAFLFLKSESLIRISGFEISTFSL